MKKMIRCGSLLLCTALLTAPAYANETDCSGSMGAVSIDGDIRVPSGRTCTAPGFVGDDEVGDTLGRVLRARSLRVRVVVHPLQLPAGDRRTLAARCEALILPAPAVADLGTRTLGRTPPAAILDRRSCPSISTTPPPPRSSPKPSRR